MRAIVLFFLVSGMLSACDDHESHDKSGGVSKDKPQIVTSIKPIQAIVLAIADNTVDVKQLIPDHASPHDYNFKPSDIRKLENADIVFRIDKHMETQLNGVLDNLHKHKTTIVSLAGTIGLTLLDADHRHVEHDNNKQDHGENHDEEKEHKHDNHESKDDGHDQHNTHDNVDFHLWTSPKNAVLMAKTIANNLAKFDTKNANLYQQNIERFFAEVKTESDKISAKLQPYKNKPYIVFHNSWQYFAAEFGLQKPIVIDLHEGVSSGAKTVSDIRERIVKENINCVFYDSSVSLARLNVITEKAKTVEIDVLAKNLASDQTTYINWLVQLGDQIESCLSE